MSPASSNHVTLTLFYATNRGHIGKDRFKPDSYGSNFSGDGQENLRFGKVTVNASRRLINKYLRKDADRQLHNGEALTKYFTKCAKDKSTRINAFKESAIEKGGGDDTPKLKENPVYGSVKFFEELQAKMMKKRGASSDVLIFIHGYNVSWHEAVGTALALNWMQNNTLDDTQCEVEVVLFSWPSDGSMMPFFAYSSDREDARGSGKSFGRGMLKLRDHLHKIKEGCGRNLHVLCHSMGNYVLEQSLSRLGTFENRQRWPRMFDQVFLCSADVNEDTLEDGKPLGDLHKLGNNVSVYFNRGDKALIISDITKGQPDRLGNSGAARPNRLHHKVQQVDCAPVAEGIIEHAYYLWGPVSRDIRQSIEGFGAADERRSRTVSRKYSNTWLMEK